MYGLFYAYANPKTKNLFQQKLWVGYVYIEESFDTIFNMGYGGRTTPPPPPPWIMGL